MTSSSSLYFWLSFYTPIKLDLKKKWGFMMIFNLNVLFNLSVVIFPLYLSQSIYDV